MIFIDRPLHPYTRMLLSAVPSCDPQKKKRKMNIKEKPETENDRGAFSKPLSYKMEICEEEQPRLKSMMNKRFCACHRAGSI